MRSSNSLKYSINYFVLHYMDLYSGNNIFLSKSSLRNHLITVIMNMKPEENYWGCCIII